MGLSLAVSYPIPEGANQATTMFGTRAIQPYAVGNSRKFELEERYLKTVKQLFEIIRKSRGVQLGTADVNAMNYFTSVDQAKKEFSLRIDLIRSFDKGKGPPVVIVVDTMSEGNQWGANIARLDLKKCEWRTNGDPSSAE